MVQCEPKRAHRVNPVRDTLSSVVVFLVALPLCLGIALACGVPPALGLISGIIGGIVVGALSGAPLQVSGPTAGQTVLVFDLVDKHGLGALGVTVIIAGLIQIMFGVFKVGRWFRAVSPAVIYGMLSGIGLLIIASQVHVMLDQAPRSAGLTNIAALPEALSKLFADSNNSHLIALAIALQTLLVLNIWKWLDLGERLRVPAALPAIGLAVALAWFLNLPVKFVDIPNDFASSLSFPGMSSLSHLANHEIFLDAIALALIASAETLLSAAAVDQLHHGPRAHNDKELIAQGVGNMTAGIVGGLPLSGVVARSTVNIEAGAASRLSTILHGFWMLLIVILVPFALAIIPTASLAALLVFTGFKLIDVTVIKKLRAFGSRELLIYLSTVVMVVATDLLTGVLCGIILSLANLVYTMSMLKVQIRNDDANYTVVLVGSATLLGVPKLTEALNKIPECASVTFEHSGLIFIDHACLELLTAFEKRHTASGGTIVRGVSEFINKKHPVTHSSRAQ
jgi:MFS superfamily sulfate permease-like transporter